MCCARHVAGVGVRCSRRTESEEVRMRERLTELLKDVRFEREAARWFGDACAILVFRVLEDALRLALDSEVL